MPATPSEVIDIRRYVPRTPQAPVQIARLYAGQLVRVIWIGLAWQQAEYVNGQPTWIPRWFGYVVEFDCQIPESELLHPAQDIA